MQECSVHSLISLIFPWVQCQSLKPVLSQCSQTGFVTVDDFMPLYTDSENGILANQSHVNRGIPVLLVACLTLLGFRIYWASLP